MKKEGCLNLAHAGGPASIHLKYHRVTCYCRTIEPLSEPAKRDGPTRHLNASQLAEIFRCLTKCPANNKPTVYQFYAINTNPANREPVRLKFKVSGLDF